MSTLLKVQKRQDNGKRVAHGFIPQLSDKVGIKH